MNAALAKLMIFVYGLSIAGYVLLDGGHEMLHTLKSNLHHHEEEYHHDHEEKADHHHNTHHHVEDHQSIFTPDADQSQSTESKDSVQIFSFLLFFQTPSALFIPDHSADFYGNGLLQKLLTSTRAPLTPPPLS